MGVIWASVSSGGKVCVWQGLGAKKTKVLMGEFMGGGAGGLQRLQDKPPFSGPHRMSSRQGTTHPVPRPFGAPLTNKTHSEGDSICPEVTQPRQRPEGHPRT